MNSMHPSESRPFVIPIGRNVAEYTAILAWWLILLWTILSGLLDANGLTWLVILGCWVKTALFGGENMKQLYHAAKCNLAHHRFLLLMGVNMSQMILSFAFDFHLLYSINNRCFTGVSEVGTLEALFNFFYLSTLNFSFFGYSDILPQTVAAKVVNLTEIVLAFVTVIFLLSDFISLKESLRNRS
jgi:hypothetical protein